MSLSLVPKNLIDKDPTKLAYHFPQMPVGRFKQRTDGYYRARTIKAVEDTLALVGAVLLPSSCIHHKRRDPSRRTVLYGRTYYVVAETDMTDLEWEKYKCICEGKAHDASGI